MKKPSIKDIAELSGVSVATVSRVINNNGRFSEETRKKVMTILESTGYQMNYNAKSLRMNKSFSVGILVPDISNYFFADVLQKIEELLFLKNYSTIICNTGRNLSKEDAYLKMLESKGVDGLIVISGADEFGFEYTDPKKDIPYICIDRKPKNQDDTIFISSNHYQGAFEATEELLRAHSKTPLLIRHKRSSTSANERILGFKDAFKKNNLVFTDKKNILSIDMQSDSGRLAFKEHLETYPEIDGIFAINDAIAMELLSWLNDLEKKVPEQVKLIGFDDIPQDKFTSPTLSSIQQDTQQIAEKAVESLLHLISKTEKSGASILVPVRLKARQSTKYYES